MNSINQNLLNQKISLLKNNIQDIIDKCSSEVDTNIIANLQIKKKDYINELETSMKDLKILKGKQKLNQEYNKASRANDSLEYYRIKKKPNSAELMSELKQKREQAQIDFQKMKEIEEEYSKKEDELSPNIPGFIFFYRDIITMYGMCPYIKISDDIFEKRREWLNNQKDKGILYYNIYDKIVNKLEYNVFLEDKKNLETYFITLHKDYLNESQYQLLQDIEFNIKEYINSNIKTKKLKDKFKIIVNNISNLVMETGMNINDYIKEYYGIYIPINIPVKNERSLDLTVTEDGDFISNLYNEKVLNYSKGYRLIVIKL